MRLPIDTSHENFLEAMESEGPEGTLVLSAPTGSGKSTRVPVWCWRSKGPVLVVEPRRIACRTLARWVANGLEQQGGETVGYSVRYEQVVGPSTEILFVTPGVARRMLAQSQIEKFSSVIIDEFHERGWETDTVTALLASKSPRPRLVLMSATLAAQRLAKTYQARIVESQGRAFPVEVEYLWNSADSELTVPSAKGLVSRVVNAVKKTWDGGRQGSHLVFLPGLASMREVSQQLRGFPVKLLHGTFANSEQDQAFSNEAPRIVLATNVAESSLTVPGITTVIDSGLEKRQIHQSGYIALATVPIAKSSADQRAGRAGRTAPGRCYRLWNERARLDPARPPELESMELDDVLLYLSSLPSGLKTPATWLDLPPKFAWERACLRLTERGLLTETGRATKVGETMSRLPVDTDWGRLLALAPVALRRDLCGLYALSSSRRPLLFSGATDEISERRDKDFGKEPWRRALAMLRSGDPAQHGLDSESLKAARRLSRELEGMLEQISPPAHRDATDLTLVDYLARVWPERFFVRRRGREEAWGNGSVECRLARGEELPTECQAALILQVEPILGRGLKVELRGRWALPTSFSKLRSAGFGEPTLDRIRWVGSTVSAKVAWRFAGRVISEQEEELSGRALRLALLDLLRCGRWMRGAWELWTEEVAYLELRAVLGGGTWSDSLEGLVGERLLQLGIENSQDLELLEPEDVHPCLFNTDELADWRKRFPLSYQYGGVAYAVTYQPAHSKVTLSWRSGPKGGAKPSVPHLPRWNGWRVDLEERGRVVPLRP